MDIPKPGSLSSNRFMDRLVVFMRSRGLAYRTEKTYKLWIKRFILYSGYTSPSQMNPRDVESFLSYLASERSASVNTQRNALIALVFGFRELLGVEVGELLFQPARKPKKLPVVLSKEEAGQILLQLSSHHKLIVQLMYGSGPRIMEAVRLRLKDVDIANNGIWVQETKEGADLYGSWYVPNRFRQPGNQRSRSIGFSASSARRVNTWSAASRNCTNAGC